MSPGGAKSTAVSLLVLAVLGILLWQAFEMRSLRAAVEQNQARIEASNDAAGAVASKAAEPQTAGRNSDSVDQAAPASEGQPPPFVDITSTYKKKTPERAGCTEVCVELANCALDGVECRGVNTKNHDRLMNLCLDRCRADRKLGVVLVRGSDCGQKIALARTRVTGFVGVCDGKE